MPRITVKDIEAELPLSMAEITEIWEKAVEEGVESLSHEELSELMKAVSRLMRSNREEWRRVARAMDEYIRERLDEKTVRRILVRGTG